MRALLISLLALFSFHSAAAQTYEAPKYLLIPPSEINRIQGVIASQVAAFRQGDIEAAYSYASPGIQEVFPTPEIFGFMVESGYGQIFNTYRYEFLDVIGSVYEPIQVVQFTGADLTTALAFYLMEIQPDGQWRIAGVQIQGLAELGV